MSKAGIDFVIGGKNLAGAAFSSVLNSLDAAAKASIDFSKSFATISGGVTKSLGSLTAAAGIFATAMTAGVAKSLGSVQRSMNKTKAVVGGLKKAMQGLLAVLAPLLLIVAAVKAVMAAVGGIKAANEAYDYQTNAVKRLNRALKIRGAEGQSKQYQQLASELQKLTGVGDEVTIGLMHTAASMEFATDRIGDATKAAIGLSEATGKTADQSLGDLKAALEGNFDAFVQVNPQIRYMRSNQEKLAAVMTIANQGLMDAAGNMTSVGGSGRRATGAMGDLMEKFGEIMAPIRVLINAGIQQLSESLQSVLAPAANYATEIMSNMGPMIDWVKTKVVAGVNAMIKAWTFFEVILTNLNDVWDIVKAYAEMRMIAIKDIIRHVLTEAIPRYGEWFAANFVNLFKDAFNGVVTVVGNAGAIIGDMVFDIFDFIASGGAGGVGGLMVALGRSASRSLLDGFESSLTSLPEIAERKLTEREQDLADKIGKIGGRLGSQFSDKMKERMVGVGATLTEEMKAAGAKLDLKGRPSTITQGVNATEGRLLTRGPGISIPNKLDQIINLLKNPQEPKQQRDRTGRLVDVVGTTIQHLKKIQDNTANTLQMEAIV